MNVIAVLATLDTKAEEAQYLREQLEQLGSRALIVDMGVIHTPGTRADVGREEIARAGGTELAQLLSAPTREAAAPVMIAGAIATLQGLFKAGELHGILGLGGLQGTAACTAVMRAMPYGLPKIMVSTAASGDTAAYVGIKDITMMFSVSDILGLNSFTRRILAGAAGAAHGMALVGAVPQPDRVDKPLIGISNLGVLTRGTLHAVQLFRERGYESIVFHAIGSGGRAMEQMMKEGVIGAVFDYAMGEISDEVFGALRAGGPERLTVAGKLGLPQVLCPGGAEHLGILVQPNTVPEEWKEHTFVFHSPVVFVPRLRADELARVAADINSRLQHTHGKAVLFIPKDGTGSYAMPDGPLRDTLADAAFFDALKSGLPDTIEIVERDTHAEDPSFVAECVARLVEMIEADDA
ncbi:MAG: hypothetical protein ACI8QZ_001251 [Chlamydiales bacterium]|jgi:uncharacterized protein (UPF0261 family)